MIICLKEIGKSIQDVISVGFVSRTITYFSLVLLPRLCEVLLLAIFNREPGPRNYDQYWIWIKSALPSREQVYMLGLAAICWVIWKPRNKTCSEKKPIKNPDEIIYSACSFMCYWIGLYQETY
jgi:hypothetical protein